MYYVISLSVQRTTHLIHPINSQVSLKHMKAWRSSQEAGLRVWFNLQTAHDGCDEVGWVLSISVSLPLKSTRDPFHHRQVSPTSLDIGAQCQSSWISLSNRKPPSNSISLLNRTNFFFFFYHDSNISLSNRETPQDPSILSSNRKKNHK